MATNSYSILKQLEKGRIKLHELERIEGITPANAAMIRAEYIERKTKTQLNSVKRTILNPQTAKGNIENMIGAVQIPLGIAGPIRISGSCFKGEALIPLATTEGALVASVNRGCKAINQSGGTKTRIIDSGQTRAPLFEAMNERAATKLITYLKTSYKELKRIGESESRHLKLKSIEPYTFKNLVWLRIKAETGDAMGMNMISIAAQNIGRHIESKIRGIKYLSVSGNMCIDKKPSELTLIKGRGKYVTAETTLTEKAITKTLKTTAEKMEKLNLYKNIIGSTIAGSYGMNAHFANMIAAVYLATGQDIAHVVDGSHGITHMEAKGKCLHVSVTIPAIQVGTIGGGTNLPCQRECISLMGLKKSKKSGDGSKQLAEIVAAAVLAGEISAIAALSSNQLVEAHKRLNR